MKITLTNNVARTSAALLCAVSVYTLASSDAYAQVPSRVAPELIQKRFDKPTNTAPSRDVGLPAAADVEQLSPKARAQLEKKQIILKKITFQGNTVFSNDDLAFA